MWYFASAVREGKVEEFVGFAEAAEFVGFSWFVLLSPLFGATDLRVVFLNSYTIKVTDIDDPDTFLYNRKILIETQEFIEKQIARLK